MAGTVTARPMSSLSGYATQLLLQYVGFEDTPSRREYQLVARRGDETRQYTVWIDLAAFTKRKVLRQDGPDICYQKLRRELAEALVGANSIGVTEADLATYREAHFVKGRL